MDLETQAVLSTFDFEFHEPVEEEILSTCQISISIKNETAAARATCDNLY